jgi:hypothetical protein
MTTKEHNSALFQEWNNTVAEEKTLMFSVFMDKELKPCVTAVPLFKDTELLKSLLVNIICGIDSAKKIEYKNQ